MPRAISDRSLALAGLVLGALALLFSVNAGSWAVAAVSSLKKNSVKSAQIVDGTIRSTDIATGAVRGSDISNATIGLVVLSPAVSAKLAAAGTPGMTGAVGTPGAAGAIGPVGPAGPAGPGLATGSVRSAEILDHSLVADDVAKAVGSASINYSQLSPGICQGAGVNVGTAATGEVVLVTPGSGWLAGLTYTVQPAVAASEIIIVACNVSVAPIDAPTTTFQYIVLST